MARTKEKDPTAIGPVTNGAAAFIEMSVPYQARVEVTGVADFLAHRWNVEAIEDKGRAPKGSEIKKTDDLESYVYRDEDEDICIPGTYLIGALIGAAKFAQDPRSPRKSAQDLFKAGVVSLTALASLGTKKWDYEDKRRAPVQQRGITRVRPAFKAGWKVRYDLQVVLPEYIPPALLQHTLVNAGRLCGLGDYRPSYGRFAVTHFEKIVLQ
jgi:hypothetical protein